MKSKKLFAILTLVAFLMTLVPAMAFGTDEGEEEGGAVGVAYNEGYSKTDVDDEVLDAGDSTTITVEFRDDDNKRLSENSPVDEFWVKTSKRTVKVTVDPKYVVDESKLLGGNFKKITKKDSDTVVAYELDFSDGPAHVPGGALKVRGSRSEIEFEVTSAAACVVEISFWSKNPGKDGCDGDPLYRIGAVVEIEFESKEGKIYEVNLIPDDTTVTAGDEITLTAEVLDKNNDGIFGKTVTFYKSDEPDSGWSKIGTATTNRKGEAEFEYTETEAGDFYYYAKCGNKDSRDSKKEGKKITVEPEEPSVIEFVTDEGKCFDVDANDNNKIKFVVKDVYGNKITSASDCEVEVKVTSAPDDSDLEDEKFDIAWDTEDEELYIEVDFDKVGEYTFKAKVSGASAILTVKAVEVGDPVEIDVRFDEKKSLIAKDADNRDKADILNLEVVVIDENGVETDADDYKVYSSNVSLAKVKEVDTGEVTLLGPSDKDDRGVVTITVVDRGSGLTDSIEVPVVGEPYAIDVDYTVSGKTATVTLQYVDDEGEVTASGDDDNYEIIAPEGITIREKEKFDEDSGEASFKAIANEYGEYKLTVVTDEGIAKKFEIVIGEPKDEQKGGKGLVTMFIGSTGYVVNGVPLISDVAPFIKDGRTFVAVRPLANAFGVAPENIGWDEVTGTVTLTRDDITVTIVIGSNDIEVVQDGVISTVTADVPAFIENGRTVLPFRAVGEAFGATVSWDEATQSVTYEL